ncbi:2-polyprenyl-6-methoxyphenol hydroxylase-like oxidoreductase [Mycobacterium sp. IEC1808]|uniref:FAD-dependent oxidoreductase n=1 Tax=Mycobacterium sp. IEC1808 TaxID=1743230 RepID=UPI000A160CB4|nr:FAD-binding protein [Mycobacterium sp. IEC1808]ORW84676.1 2-polyprenyl-6-methoxyphenol hydroxylase-like oxidoreductase [Mycobacterium sp. IEC1808]
MSTNASESKGSAIVLGASVGGLLAARVLADFYDIVTVVERDVLPDGPQTRRGVPQGAQPHTLPTRAAGIMDRLFPGFLDELVAGGARVWNDGDLSRLWLTFAGHPLLRSGEVPDPESIVIHHAHRPFLEWNLRRRVRGIPNVTFLDAHDVVRLTSTPQRERVTGVVLAPRDSGAERTLTADLVVDTTGRGSRTPLFLEQLGYRPPREDKLTVHVTYASMRVYVAPGTLRENFIINAAEPGRPVAFAMFGGEDDTYVLAVQTMAGRPVPTDRAALLNSLTDVAPPHALAAARSAEPVTDVAQYKFPSNRWRRYDKLERVPDGLIVMGDAMCNFNPLYGQGMSVAAIEALILRDCLEGGEQGLPRRFFGLAAKEIGVAWRAAVASDLALPQIAGNRTVSVRLRNAYLDHVLSAAETEPVIVQKFLRMMNMVSERAELFHPSTMLQMIARPRKRLYATR